MKIYKFIWAAVCLTPLLLLSCNDDFLERYPLDEVSNETFWNTENDLMVTMYLFFMVISMALIVTGEVIGF